MRPLFGSSWAVSRGSFGSALLQIFVGQLGFSILSFVGLLMTARLLGPSGRGDLAILILVPTLYAAALEFGQESTVSHLAARSSNEAGRLHANALVYAIGLLLPAAAVVGLTYWSLGVTPADLVLLGVAGGLATAAGVYLRMLTGLTIGTGRIGLLNVTRALLGTSSLVFVLVLWLDARKSSALFFYAWALTTVCGSAMLGVWLRKVWSHPSRLILAEQWRIGFPVHLSNVAQIILLRGDQFLLFALASPAAVGHYSVAVNVAEILWYLPVAAGLASLPTLSSSAPDATKRRELSQALRISVLLTLAGAIVLALVAPMVVPLLFGNDFEKSVLPLELLLPGIVVAAVVRVCSAALIVKGRTSVMWKIMFASVIVNMCASFALIPFFGASGAALASTAAYVLAGVALLLTTIRAWDPQRAALDNSWGLELPDPPAPAIDRDPLS